MHYSINLSSAVFLLATLSTTQAFMITFYASSGCHGGAPVKQMYRPESGCQTYQAGVSKSHLLTGDGSDKSFFVVYFKDKECNPDQIIKKADLAKDFKSSCVDVSGGYQSFQVWNVCAQKNCLE